MSATPTLLNETGKFYLDNQNSEYVTLAFSGDDAFLKRTENFLYNYGVLRSGSVHKLKDQFNYIHCPLSRLDEALMSCFRGEIIKEKSSEIDYIVKMICDEVGDEIDCQIEWNEQKVTDLANERANLFMERIERVSLNIYSENAGESEVYTLGRV
jgi:hypothetical protein